MRKYPLSLLKDKNIVTFFDFWGKTRRGEKDGGDDYHLLCWHSLDVAAMGYLMVKRNCFGLADYFRQLGISDKEQAAQFFAWLLCWHDIGKFARSFQQLYLPPELKIQEGARKNYEKISHSTLGYWLWNHYLSECQELLPSSSLSPRKLRRVIEMWMPVTTGHHGRPPDRMDELDNFLPEDKAAARDFLLEIKPLFPLIEIPAFWDDDEGIELIKHLSWYISATVVLADWTGSSTRFFPRVAHPMDIKGYWQKTLIQAQNALTVFPLKAKVAPFNGINTLFPFIENPTPLQQKVLDLDISQQGPQLFILEDVTGAGKTEAALILAHRLIAAGKAQGLFFGLPTMATANAMYDRLVKTWLAFYSPESRPSLVLAHSARTLMDRFNESLWSGDLVGSEEPDEQTFSQGCAAWFADSNKKALLAEIGVGTLDQAMMAVMPFKHNNLRLLGLSNKILLADEIHACDAYMSCILEGLIERQARGGNSVILLSATLSQQQRDKLVAAFARGTEGLQEAPFLEKDDYPWLTHVTKSDVNSHRVRGIEGSRVRQTYALLAKQYGVKWNGRKYDPKDWEKGDVVNRCISAATSCLYGISEAAVLAAGYAPAIGFIHSGKPLSFVYDIADIIKFDSVVPKAFEIAARQPAEPDKEVRLACRDIFRSTKLTGKLIPLIEEVLAAGEIEPPQPAPDMLPPAIPEPETLGDSGHRGRG